MQSSLPYIQDLIAQPQALTQTIRAFEITPALASLVTRIQQKDFKRIILTGMGSSFHAFFPFFSSLADKNFTVQILETSELIHQVPGLMSSDSLVIAASQSGESAEIVRLLEHPQCFSPILGITNTQDSSLAKKANAVVLTRAGNESNVSCKTYLATLAALSLLSDFILTNDFQKQKADLEIASDSVNQYLKSMTDHIKAAKNDLKGIRFLELTGRGASLAAVGTGALIIKESSHFPTEGLSSASFRHGPFEMVSPELFVLVFKGYPRTSSLNEGLYKDILSAGGKAALVSYQENTDWYCLPPAPSSCLPLMEILPAQVLSVALAEISGIEAGNFKHGSKITTVE